MFGTLFSAVEPNIQAVALSGGGGTSVDIARTAITGRLLAVAYGQANRLLNVIPPVVAPPQCPYYDPLNDNYVFRDQPGVNSPSQPSSTGLCPVSVPETGVKVNHVPGAIVVQAGFESADWLQMLGDPLSFASHLKLDPLPGNTPKPVLFLFAEGDPEVPNPANSAFIRAAGIADRSWLLQSHQLVNPQLSPTYPVVKTNIPNVFVLNPHRLLSNPDVFSDPGQRSIALAEQQQVAEFLNSDGTTNPNPNGVLTGPFKESDKLFVVPQSLPDQLNYLPVPAPPSNQQ
jgi:hypothetical protein